MEEQKVEIQKSMKLEKAFTYFMIPFYYEGEDYKVLKVSESPSDAMWEASKGKILNEEDDVLYSYIINFIQGKTNDHLDIYNINSDAKSPARKFWDVFSQKPIVEDEKKKKKSQQETEKKEKNEKEPPKSLHSTYLEVEDENGEKTIIPTTFDLQRDNGYTGLKSPHLFISPSANTGILTFCIGLGERNRTMDDLKRLNYCLHKISKPLNKCTTSSFSLKERTFYNEEARISTHKNIIGYRNIINAHDDNQKWSPDYEFSWNIRTLIDSLLSDVKGIKHENGRTKECDIQLFSDTRAHLFTFCQIDGIQTPYEYEGIKLDLMRLSRCVNDKYMLPVDEAMEKDMCLKTFSNIYFSSSVEGAAMIAISKKENEDFVKQIDNQGLPRYLSIYLLVMIQRYSMLNINRRLTELCADTSDTSLWDILKIIKKVKVHCYYTDVSPYSQHNQFYQHCNKNLHVRETFNEIDNKTKVLNLTISHDMQVLMEEQKNALEVQRLEEIRREKEQQALEKQRNEDIKRSEQKAESGQRRLNLVVGVLTVFQVAGVIFEFTDGTGCWRWVAIVITFVLGFFLLYLVMKWDDESIAIVRWAHRIWDSLWHPEKK